MRSPARREPQDIQPNFVTIVASVLVSSVATSATVAGIAYSFGASTDVIGYATGIALLLSLCVGVVVNTH